MPDLYDAEFQRLLRRSKDVIERMPDKEDRIICAKWVAKLCKLQSNDISVKKNRNDFFKYMIHIISQGTMVGPFQSFPDPGPLPDFSYTCEQGSQRVPEVEEEPIIMTRWSDDGRTFLSVKAIPNRGALIYMAMAKDVSLGWELPQSDNLV